MKRTKKMAFAIFFNALRHQTMQVYKIIKEEKERRKVQDPLYVAAKHFRESMVRTKKQEKKKQKLQEKQSSEMQ